MTPLATRAKGGRGLVDRRQQVTDALVGAVAALTLLAAAVFARPAHFVGRIEVVNPTRYHVEVDVRGGAGGAWMSLGAFRRESRRVVEEVLDQGDSWALRFSYGGFPAGELLLSRDDVRRQVTIPPEVGDRLAAAGFPPSSF